MTLLNHLSTAALVVASMLCSTVAVAKNPLPRSTPEAQGVDSAGVLGFVGALEEKINAVHSIMIVRHGKVVAEGWWAPYAADDPHVMYSVSKAITSTAVGIAAQEGLLNVNDRVLSHFPELAPAKPAEHMKNMRLRDLLRMSTGHQKEASAPIKARKDGAWTRGFLETEVENKPGTHFVYNSIGTYVLGATVQKVSGTTLEEYLRPRLFEPLGIERPHWVKSAEGVNLGDGGISLRTEDLAKFGLLYLQKGVWNGERLLSEQWVEEATSRQVSTGGDPEGNWDAGYGYQFWQNKVTGYRADGAFGQFSFVLPKYDAVVAVTSGTSDMSGVMDAVWKHLLPALRERPLAENRAAHDKLTRKLGSMSLPVQAGAPTMALAADVSKKSYAFGKNELGISTASVDFSDATPRITLVDADGTHVIPCGAGQWVRSMTAFQKQISSQFDTDPQSVAASCGWADDHTFVAKLCFNQTPFTLTSRFTFERAKLLIDLEHNLRWGETKRPQLVGKAR